VAHDLLFILVPLCERNFDNSNGDTNGQTHEKCEPGSLVGEFEGPRQCQADMEKLNGEMRDANHKLEEKLTTMVIEHVKVSNLGVDEKIKCKSC
jgi:hypothetical protein